MSVSLSLNPIYTSDIPIVRPILQKRKEKKKLVDFSKKKRILFSNLTLNNALVESITPTSQ